MKLDNILINAVEVKEYSLYHYGSTCFEVDGQRDVDVFTVTNEMNAPSLRNLTFPNVAVPCNMYFIPVDVFLDDMAHLSYGGYYAHKLALAYREIKRTQHGYDVARRFWTTEVKAYFEKRGKMPFANELILWTHSVILSFNPTFGRSLAGFIRSSTSRMNLLSQVNTILDGISPTTFSHLPLSRRWDAALFLFWKEYRQYKDGTMLWGCKSLSKLRLSLVEYDEEEICRYFEIGDLTKGKVGT